MTTGALWLLALCVVALLTLLAWAIYYLLPEKVFLLDGRIVKKHKGQTEELLLSRLSEIKFHYHAVVGFIGIWEFVDKDANTLSVDAKAKGIKELIAALEKELPGFSSTSFDQRFREGDVEDTIDVWKTA